jgi:hypothetical protein
MAMLFKGGLPVSKTPGIVTVIGAVVLAATVGSATTNLRPTLPSQPFDQSLEPGFNALDGRRLEGSAPTPWPPGAPGAANRPGLNLDGFDPIAGPTADALPLAQFTGADAKPPPRASSDVRQFLDRFRFGGLPEPASWALILIGFAMIGGAFRGLVAANRRLARLQPED